ncbi:MAG: hypothetical protein ACOYBW_03340 [Fluviibacter phosphoraccumulans]|jgi:hypothetical protein|uniref:hypothetical protein n=1 Tax=Fluviibacter phosphoraccumulans TaxID=1751046 RepID=UPI0024E1CC0F|nr:hypothetical protein [Fluviibacter phosphoraccumulans]
MLRADEVRLFDFMANQARAFAKTACLAGMDAALNAPALAAIYYFLGQQNWNPSARDFLNEACALDAHIADHFTESFAAFGLQAARINDMTKARYRQLCAA